MSSFPVRQAADLLGVSDDTVRRWVEAGRLEAAKDDGGKLVVEGAELARFAEALAAGEHDLPGTPRSSARNRFPGLVTRVVKDTVMAEVQIQSGPHRFVSLMSRESAESLGLEPGVLAVASIKSTTVVVEVPTP